jgi:hypothetical protein
VADVDNQDQQAVVLDLVNDAVITDAHAVDAFGSAEFRAAMRSGLDGKRVDSIAQSP